VSRDRACASLPRLAPTRIRRRRTERLRKPRRAISDDAIDERVPYVVASGPCVAERVRQASALGAELIRIIDFAQQAVPLLANVAEGAFIEVERGRQRGAF